jgi:hypothetical protein
VPLLKYILAPIVWSTLPIIAPVATRPTGQLFLPSPINKTFILGHTASGNTDAPTFARLPPPILPWKDPYRISFVDIQNNRQITEKGGDTNSYLQDMIGYQGNDSITFDLKKQTLDLYGASALQFSEIELSADHINFDGRSGIITATGKVNEDGKIKPKPVVILKKENATLVAEEIRYNINSKRGTAKRLFTKREEAIIQCKKAKVDPPDTYYADRVEFTTCNLVKPHYFVKARKVKYVQDTLIASGPFQFYFDGVPTALGFFYGLFFIPMPKNSGVLPPHIGEDSKRGFYLRDGGYYIYFNDYIDLAILGTIYSKGDSNLSAVSNYKKRYSFSGKLAYTQGITSNTPELALQEDKEKEWRLTWTNKTEDNRISSLTADVDIQSRSKRHSLQKIGKPDNLNAKTQSKIRHSYKNLGPYYTLNTSAAHSKDFQNNLTQVTLPEVSLVTKSIYPFRGKNSLSNHWYQEISFTHTSEFQSKFSNVVEQDTLEISKKTWPTIIKDSKYGFKHTFPIEANKKLLTFFNLKPFAQYTERWYFKRYDYKYDASEDKITADTVTSFNRIWDYNLGSSLETTVYGTHFFNEEAFIKAIRHRIDPLLKLTYHPDFSEEKYGYYQKINTRKGESKEDKFKGGPYGTPPSKASALLEAQINNVLETKIQDDDNPLGKSKKIPLAESLYGKTSYDFLADSFPLGDLKFGVRNRFLNNLINVEYNNKYDPYIYVNRKRVEEFAWQHGKGLGTMKEYTFKISTHVQSEKYDIAPDTSGENDKRTEADIQNQDEEPPASKKKSKKQETTILLDSSQYVDFDLPWQFDIAYQQNFTYNIPLDTKETIRQIVFNGELNITKNWKTTFSSVYDIDKKELVGSATKVGIYRDLHCWQMKFDWVPLANVQSYDFSIGIKAPLLEEVKLPHSREYEKV